MRLPVGYLAGAAVSLTGGFADLAYINLSVVPRLLEVPVFEAKPIEAVAAAEVIEVLEPIALVAPPPPSPAREESPFQRVAVLRFKTASARLDRRARAQLDDLALKLRSNAMLSVRSDGYADSRGPSPFNQYLSEQRAERVAVELEKRGIDRSRIESRGFGERTATAEWFLDRRVEISVGERAGGREE